MPVISVITRTGDRREVTAVEGVSLMEALRDGGVDDIVALCGGCCSCATCHVHVDPDFAELLSPMEGDEDDLLDSCTHRDGDSRLSCQIPVTAALDGMTVRVAAED